jgi:hypothetical protein
MVSVIGHAICFSGKADEKGGGPRLPLVTRSGHRGPMMAGRGLSRTNPRAPSFSSRCPPMVRRLPVLREVIIPHGGPAPIANLAGLGHGAPRAREDGARYDVISFGAMDAT